METEKPRNSPQKEIIEVTDQMVELLKKKLSLGHKNAIKMLIQIFSICFNEKELKNSSIIYDINSKKIMNQILDLYFLDTVEVLRNLLKKDKDKKEKVLIMIYLKNSVEFLQTTQNDSLIIRTLNSILHFSDLFIGYPSLNKKLIKSAINIWGNFENFSVKFYSFLLIKKILENSSDEIKNIIFKNMIVIYSRTSSDISWRRYDSIIFSKNCIIESFGLSPEIAYVAIYEKLKMLSSKLIQISKEKSLQKIKKLYNFKTLHLCNLFTQTLVVFHKNVMIRELTYPILEFFTGLINLYNQTNYYPYHLKILEMMNEIELKTSIKTPIFYHIQIILQNKFFRKNFYENKKKGFEFFLNIKSQDIFMMNNKFWDDLLKNLLSLIIRHLSHHVSSPYFQDYSFSIYKFLKRLYKSNLSMEKKQIIKKNLLILRKDIGKFEEKTDKEIYPDTFVFEKNNFVTNQESAIFKESRRLTNEHDSFVKLNIISSKKNAEAEEKK